MSHPVTALEGDASASSPEPRPSVPYARSRSARLPLPRNRQGDTRGRIPMLGAPFVAASRDTSAGSRAPAGIFSVIRPSSSGPTRPRVRSSPRTGMSAGSGMIGVTTGSPDALSIEESKTSTLPEVTLTRASRRRGPSFPGTDPRRLAASSRTRRASLPRSRPSRPTRSSASASRPRRPRRRRSRRSSGTPRSDGCP